MKSSGITILMRGNREYRLVLFWSRVNHGKEHHDERKNLFGFEVTIVDPEPAVPILHRYKCVRRGLKHPISGLDHVVAMIAVGLWGAQLGAPAIWVLPVAFPMMMALGGMLGLLGVPLPSMEIGVAASSILLGAAVTTELRPPLALAGGLVGFFAIFHGYAHGSELPTGESGLLYSTGFVMATGCLHGIGIFIGIVHRWTWGQRALRMAGAAIAFAGIFFLWKAVA